MVATKNEQPRSAVVESPDDIVISGVGIRCSQSENIEEFAENLFAGVNMVHENLDRCDEDHFGVPKQHGFIKDIRKFDATFFGVHPKQAEGMDPQLRILHEVAYECIIDAGIDPASLKNSNTGVFIGTSNSDAREAWTSADVSEIDGYSLIGTHRAFLANRLSFTFDLRGPSFGVDAACATSGVSINQGYLHIKHGVCDAAIVGGVSLVYQPKVSYQILKLGLLCRDGKCKVFDEAADGYVRAEGIACAMLQRRKDAKRVFATLVHSKINNDGFKEQGITFPSTESQGQLITEVYSEAGIDPEDVEYVEAHGTGTTIGDPQETNGIALAFANSRTKPLPIGAVKSNMGHSEHASGVVSLCKIIIAMQTGVIPPNLHYKNPNPLIPALVDGRLKVITEPFKWNATLAGLNCFGFGGQNSHLVLRGNPNTRKTKIDDTRLVIYMGRTEEAAIHALNYARRYQDDPYVSYLLMNTASAKPASMPYRGYTIINNKSGDTVLQVDRVTTEVKPVWFVFSGQGTQWASMGRDILKLEAFRTSIEKCGHALKPHGLDLFKLLADSTDQDYDDPTISFVGIAAIQVALVDLLTSLKIDAQGFVGHSAGEIGCAYADGSFTAEEAVLAAYFRGQAVRQAKLAPGAMAAVGLSWAEASKRCKGDVTPACNNAKDNVTVSGPEDQVARFVEELKSQNVFAKEVNSYGIAFHSPAMKQAAPKYLADLKKVLPSPKMRTTRWLSTAVEENQWGSELAKFASAEYFAHNLTTTVKFHEALSKVPSNAVVIEVAPHGLLQALIKATVGSQATPVALMKKGHPNNLNFFLESIGKMYLQGLNPQVNEIFPKPQLPAPRDTPFLGPVVHWDHSASWRIPAFTDFIHKGGKAGAHHSYTFDLSDPLNARFYDNRIGNQAMFPIGNLFSMTAKAFAAETGNTIEKAPRLHFTNVEILKAVPVDPSHKLQFDVTVSKSTGHFEIQHDGSPVMTGSITTAREDSLPQDGHGHGQQGLRVSKEDVYEELNQRGFDFGPNFQILRATNEDGSRGEIASNLGYEGAINGLLQLLTLNQHTRELSTPTEIQSLIVDIPHLSTVLQSGKSFPATVYPDLSIVACPGAELEGVTFEPLPHQDRPRHAYSVKQHGFVSHSGSVHSRPEDEAALRAYTGVVASYLYNRAEEMLKKGAQSKVLEEIVKSSSLKGIPVMTKEYEHFASDPNASLLHLLERVFEVVESRVPGNVDDVLTKTVASMRPMLKDDLLLNTLTRRNVIQPVIEVVLENTSDDVIDILELLRGEQPTNAEEITTDLSSPNHAPVQFKSLPIKAGQQTEIHPASATLLVADNYFVQDVKALAGDLKTVSTILKDDGYLLVVQPFDGPANELTVFTAGNKNMHGTHLPSYKEFQDALNNEGFQVVLEKSDGVLNRLILCRKTTNEPVNKHHVVNLADSTRQEDHVRTVRQALDQHFGDTDTDASASTRVWVVAPRGRTDLSVVLDHPEVKQHPHSARLRFFVDKSHKSTTPLPFEPQHPHYSTMVSSDLRYNVHDGKSHGTLRNVPLTNNTHHDAHSAVASLNTDRSALNWHESPVQHAAGNKETVAVLYATLSGSGVGNRKMVAFAGHTVPRGEPVIGTITPSEVTTQVAVNPEDLLPVPQGLPLAQAATLPLPYSIAFYGLSTLAQVRKGDSILVHTDRTASAQSEAVIRTALLLGLEVFAAGDDQELVNRIPQLKNRTFQSLYDTNAASEILKATNGKGVTVVFNPTKNYKLQESVRVLASHGFYLESGKTTDTRKSTGHKNVSIHTNLTNAVTKLDTGRRREITKFLAQALTRGELAPLQVNHVKSLKDLSGNKEDAVVLEIRNESSKSVKATPKAHFRADKAYVVVGENAQVLTAVAYWLATRGARLIEINTPDQQSLGRTLETQRRFFTSLGVELNVTSSDSAQTVLQTALSRAPVAGVFVVDNVKYNNDNARPSRVGVADLDQASQKLGRDSLDYFVVITSDVRSGGNSQEIVEHRFANGLPAQIVQVGHLVSRKPENETETDAPTLAVNAALDALTDVVRRNSPVVIVSPPPRVQRRTAAGGDDDGSGPQDKSYLPQAVAKIMGIKDFAALDMFLSLGDYGIDSLMAMELGKILERDFNLSLTLQEIRSLCVRDICLMSGATNAVEAAKFSENKTLSEVPTLLDGVRKHYNLSELVPKEAVTLLRQVKEKKEVLFIVHPMEGAVLPVLEALANHLQVTTYGLNNTADSDVSSMEALATSYIQAIRTVQPQGPYNLAGYSFGAGVAFEMALQLQKQDKNSVRGLILLDGSHSFVGAFTKTMKGGYTVDPNMPLDEMNKRKQTAFEVAIFQLYVTQLVKTQRKQLTEKLQAARNFDERADVAAQELQRCPDLSKIPVETLRAAAVSFAERLFVADVYKPSGKYEGPLTLIKCTEKMIRNLGEFYELDKVCTKKDQLHAVTVPGNHEGFVLGESAKLTANHINQAVL